VTRKTPPSLSLPDLPLPASGEGMDEAAWLEVIQKMDEVYSQLIQDEIELERKNAELEQSHQFIFSVLGAMSDLVVACSEAGEIQETNEALRTLCGKREEELIASTPIAVVTRGGEGSVIYENGEHGGARRAIDVPVAPVEEVRDPTGAGDAYLAGLVFGLARRLPLEVTGRIAALAAAYAIEQRGCQEHYYTLGEFAERYVRTFGPAPEIEALAALAEKA